MLVLSRRQSERIKLGNSIVVTIIRVAGDTVRLGIEAPADVVILREELQPHAAAQSLPRQRTRPTAVGAAYGRRRPRVHGLLPRAHGAGQTAVIATVFGVPQRKPLLDALGQDIELFP